MVMGKQLKNNKNKKNKKTNNEKYHWNSQAISFYKDLEISIQSQNWKCLCRSYEVSYSLRITLRKEKFTMKILISSA